MLRVRVEDFTSSANKDSHLGGRLAHGLWLATLRLTRTLSLHGLAWKQHYELHFDS